MSRYSQYRGKSIGRILHYVQEYCGLHIAEHVFVGEGKVELWSAPFARISWKETGFEGVQVPWFTFVSTTWDKQQAKKFESVTSLDTSLELDANLKEAKDLLKCAEEFIQLGEQFKTSMLKQRIGEFLKRDKSGD
jgi:hypothetical protein